MCVRVLSPEGDIYRACIRRVLRISHVSVCLGEQEECAPSAPPQPPNAWPPALGLESMRITRVTMEIHKHKYALGQQRTHTHQTASPLIAFSIFNIFIVWDVMTLGAVRDMGGNLSVCAGQCLQAQEEYFCSTFEESS